MPSTGRRIAFVGLALASSLGGGRADPPATATAAARDSAIVMQSFIVSATQVVKNPWRYGAIPGFEVLTRASDQKTNWLLAAFQRGQMVQARLLQGDWLPQSAVPITVIIDDTDLATIASERVHSQPISFQAPMDEPVWGAARALISHDPLESADRDTIAINSNLYGVDTSNAACGSIPLKRLFQCAPPLPNWLIAGLLGPEAGIFREGFMLDRSSSEVGPWPAESHSPSQVLGPGMQWGSLDQTQQVLQKWKKDRKAKVPLVPLAELFGEVLPTAATRSQWQSEAGLFVRWGLLGLDNEHPVQSEAFLEFVRRARREPVTEAMFIACFGYNYAAMEDKLQIFLKATLAHPVELPLKFPSDFPEPDLAEATSDQIGRILGDWLRMKGDALRASDPELSAEFLDSAGRMLLRAYKADNGLPPDVDPSGKAGPGNRPAPKPSDKPATVMAPFVVAASRLHDPGLLAVYGLYEEDTGDSRAAHEFLEAGAKAGMARPAAWFDLAKMRYIEAISRPLGTGSKMSPQQVESILEPLENALHSSPDPAGYSLMVATWNHSDAKPGGRDVVRMDEGVAQFPRDSDLALRSAVVCAQKGYISAATGMIAQGLIFATDERERRQLTELRSLLPAPPKS